MTIKEAYLFVQNSSELNNLSGVKFVYAITKNLKKIKSEIEVLEKTLEPTNEFKEFDKKRIELAEKHSKLDEKGKPILISAGIVNNKPAMKYDVVNENLFAKEFEELKNENKEVLDARDKQMEEFQKLLEEEIPFKIHKIKLKDIPENITKLQMDIINNFIEEEEQ